MELSPLRDHPVIDSAIATDIATVFLKRRTEIL